MYDGWAWSTKQVMVVMKKRKKEKKDGDLGSVESNVIHVIRLECQAR